MARITKRLRQSDLWYLQRLRRERRRALVFNILFLSVGLGIFVAGLWYNGAVPSASWFNLYLTRRTVAGIGICFAFVPLCSLIIRLFKVHALPRVLRWQNILFLNLYSLVSIPLAWIIITIWKPFQFFHINLFSDIASACFCLAILTCILLFLTRRVLPFPRFSQTMRQIVIGLALALFLSLALTLLMPSEELSFHFDTTRVWQGGILFAMVWPLFLLHEGAVHNWAEKGTFPAFLLSMSVRGCFLTIVYVFAMHSQEKALIESTWPILVVVFLALQYCCSLLYRKGRAAIAGATLSAYIVAWVLTAHLTSVNL